MRARPLPSLRPYRNLSGNSGVVACGFTEDDITVAFRDGMAYRYGPDQPGRAHAAEMKRPAVAGRGLATYINRHVEDYEERWRRNASRARGRTPP